MRRLETGDQRSGTPKGVPRTAAITQSSQSSQTSGIVVGMLLRCDPAGFQARSLNAQRRPETIPSKKSATRRQSAQKQDSEFAYKVLRRHPIFRSSKCVQGSMFRRGWKLSLTIQQETGDGRTAAQTHRIIPLRSYSLGGILYGLGC